MKNVVAPILLSLAILNAGNAIAKERPAKCPNSPVPFCVEDNTGAPPTTTGAGSR